MIDADVVAEILMGLSALYERAGVLGRHEVTMVLAQVARRHGLPTLPSLTDLSNAIPPSRRLELARFLMRKPVRSASGVQVIAVMCKPHRCPHQVRTGASCTYCGGGPDSDFAYSTQSYTGFEPTSMRAIRARYDAVEQVRVRMEQLRQLGHDTAKVEVVLMGGTFLSMPRAYRSTFIAGIYAGLTGHIPSGSKRYLVPEAIAYAARSSVKCVALTIETRPDYCEPRNLADMLRYGTTRLEIGVQTVYDDVCGDINRGHTIRSVIRCLGQSRDAGFKVIAHMMPNLSFTSTIRDVFGFQELFQSHAYRVDGLKIYPTLIIRGTPLYERWRTGKYLRYLSTSRLVSLLAMIYVLSPPWVRIYRIMRDIPLPLITSGVEVSNLRELALIEAATMGIQSQEIRQREAGIVELINTSLHQKGTNVTRDSSSSSTPAVPEICRRDYWASGSWETFLSIETPASMGSKPPILLALCRLRQMPRGGRGKFLGIRPELKGRVSLIREVHVYGSAVGINERAAGAQHRGLGQLLVREAERIARLEHRSHKLAIIAGVGTREYYQRLGYALDGPYMSRVLEPI
ncbi:Histone acetyltransferase Elp3 [Giardia muris]|uniref:Elongator complex protein 3 n=1 Tax=Giardia muris TaxID=5742 RepID=A0A4Z1SVL0_GIAMU|nr:Histone acetyltransferase Elp3 [Giardia muris]|eukprot:TNJ29826.1 Histone acetyltransferase Elp3 [Giardia muris]